MFTPDPKAIHVARQVFLEQRSDLTILFGSRARGDQDEASSDIDIMLVQNLEPTGQEAELASAIAETAAEKAYGRYVPVQLMWRTREKYRYNRRYSNSIETNTVREGGIMPRDAESYSAHDFEDEETGYEYDWTQYNERLRHAEIHLTGFNNNNETGMDDLLIGQEGQRTPEHAMKVLLETHGASYRRVHEIGELLGNIRYNDPEMRDFRLSIQPEIYTAYEGQNEYEPRTLPMLTSFPDHTERTVEDPVTIMERAREVRAQKLVEESQ